MIIDESYYNKEKNLKLTQYEIELIIDILQREQHILFTNLELDKIIKKLRKEN